MLRRLVRPAIAAAAFGGVMLAPAAAEARVFFGFGFGLPYYAPFYRPYYAPYFYRPYASYPPAPVYYGPPVAYPAPGAYSGERSPSCNAGSYVCPLKRSLRPGTPCSCPANDGGRAYGQSS